MTQSCLELQFSHELGPDEADLLPLAQVAVCTPLVDAESTLNVLADLLVERGIIKTYKRVTIEGLEVNGQPDESFASYAPSPTPLESALAWARAKTGPSFLEKMKTALDEVQRQMARRPLNLEPQTAIVPPSFLKETDDENGVSWNAFVREIRRGPNR